ncbi:MAG: hypothetical protein O3A25_07705 [Acidobacteria bacterium]|nr:hypothetical protein [Acidobacteriota bacterium]
MTGDTMVGKSAADDVQRVALKVFLTDDSELEPAAAIPVFHRWIQTHAVDGLLIDVADYTHLPSGPSVLLVAHEGQYALDRTGGRLGLQYTRTRPLEGTLSERLLTIWHTLLGAARTLETEATLTGPVRFERHVVDCIAIDRLRAPNTPATLAALRPPLDLFLSQVTAQAQWSLTQDQEPGAPFRVTARTSPSTPFDPVR